MNNAGTAISMVAQWRLARNLFPIYCELARISQFCPQPPCSTFESDDRPESLQAIRQWFAEVDASLNAERFRAALLATNAIHTDSTLHAIAQHLLAKRDASPQSREKIEFVLLRYFSVCSPPSFHARTVTRRNVVDVLQPLLGDCVAARPNWLGPLDELLQRLESCRSVEQANALIKDAAAWKQSLGERIFEPIALAELTHFHYLLHLAIVEAVDGTLAQLMQQLEALRARGVDHLDCSAAGMSAKEPVAGLIDKWKSWMIPTDLEFCFDPVAAMLAGMQKAIGTTPTAAPDARVDTIMAEMGRVRALAENMAAQLSAVTQRLQRLEARVELSTPWTPSAEASAAGRFRSPVTPPPVMTRPEVFKSGHNDGAASHQSPPAGRQAPAEAGTTPPAPESLPTKISKIR